jgi:hypothetical protein
MFTARAAFDTQLLEDVQIFAQSLPELVDEGVRRDLRPFVSQMVDKTLRVEPGKPKYPLRWQSEKQRRAYFATNGFGQGIPYKRTHKTARGWSVRADYKSGFGGITITNSAPHAKYVFGPPQQLFHSDTGWKFAPDVLQVISLEANERLESLWSQLFFQAYRRGNS